MDDHRIVFDASPTGASHVSVEWLRKDAGTFGRDKSVSRGEADTAKIIEIGGTNSGSRTVSVTEADAYVAELNQFAADRKEALDTARQERADALAKVVATCPHCNVTRRYAGHRRFQAGGVGAEIVFGEMLTVSNVDMAVYACPTCGSVELFLAGKATHPLPGTT